MPISGWASCQATDRSARPGRRPPRCRCPGFIENVEQVMQSKRVSVANEFGRRTLSLFMDEAGHGDFQSGQRFFAIGGIAGLGPQVEHATKLWRELKGRHFGDSDAPLPACGKMMTPPQIEAISGYFARSKLPRFVFIIKRPPIFPPSINVLRMLHPIMVEELTRMIGELPTL